MTSLVEMTSIPPWKSTLSNVNGNVEEYPEVDSNFSGSRSRGPEMLDIPTWKRELMSKRTTHAIQDSKKTCVFDSSTISPVIDTNSNDIKTPGEPTVTEKVEEKPNSVNPVKSEVSTNNLISSTTKMGTNTNTSNGSKVSCHEKDKRIKSLVETSHLKHVHSNPFFEKLGVEHPHGNIYDQNDMTNGNGTDDDDDMQEEYAPNSGFVDKLRLKFAKLNQQKTFKSTRRFASLESLVDVGKSKNELKSTFEKPSYSNQRNEKSLKSSDCSLNNVTRPKLRRAPNIPTHRPRISSAELSSATTNELLGDLKHDQFVSADFIKGRDDIIIIEQEVKQESPTMKKTHELPESGSIKSLKGDNQTSDLPIKPNTVINFRSLFEKKVSNTQNILPDSYVTKFMTNLSKGKLPPKPSVPPRRASQDMLRNVTKVENEIDSKENAEKVEDVNDVIINPNESETAPSQSVKDLTMLFKQKPERPFESPKSKRRSPEKKAIFDSSAIVSEEVKEEFIVKSVKKEDHKIISPRSVPIDKPVIPRKKPERINKPKVSPQVSVEEKNVTESKIEVKLTTIDVKTSESTSLFPQRKQIFDSSNITETVATPVAPPRAKGHKRSTTKKQAPNREVVEKVEKVTNSIIQNSQLSTDMKKEDIFTDKNEQDKHSPAPTSETPRVSVEDINERNKQKQLEAEKHLNKISQNMINNEAKVIPNNLNSNEDNKVDVDTPTRGLPSIIAKRLNKNDNKLNLGRGIIPLTTDNDKDSDEEEVEPRLIKPSQLRSVQSTSPSVPNKEDIEKSSETLNFKDVLKSSSKNNQVPRTNIDDLIRGQKKPSAVFDSSNIAVLPKAATNGVPPLNLSDLVGDKPLEHNYQEGYIPTKIAPCTYVFEGAGVKLKTTPMMKRRKQKGKITFHEDPKLHEYQSEDAALKDYLEENPHEVEEVKKEEAILTLSSSLQDESSDDVDEPSAPTTPREEGVIKSNTPLAHATGELTNYRSKYQTEDFKFGMSFSEPEPETKKEETVSLDHEDMDLVPADENSTINYTDSSISDMLF